MAKMTPWVRQYALRDLLDASIDLFKQRAGTLLLAGLIPYAFVIVYLALMRFFFSPGHFEPEGATPLAYFNALRANPELIYYNIGFFIISLLAIVVGYIAQCRIAVNHTLQQDSNIGQSYKRMIKPLFSILLIGIFYSVLLSVFIGIAVMAAGVIISIFALVLMNSGTAGEMLIGIISIIITSLAVLLCYGASATYLLAAPVITAVENASPFSAIGRSFNTASSNFRVHFYALLVLQHIPLIIVVLLAMLAGIIQYLLNMLAPVTVLAMVSVLSWVGIIFMLALFSCLQSLVYLDGRCRRDNLDLLLIGEEIGIGREVAAALSGNGTYANAPYISSAGSLFPDYSIMPDGAPAVPPIDRTAKAEPIEHSASSPGPVAEASETAPLPQEESE